MSRIMELAPIYAENYRDGGGDTTALQAEVTRMEAEIAEAKRSAGTYEWKLKVSEERSDELRAKLATLETEKAEREKQKPVGYTYTDKGVTHGAITRVIKAGEPLYLSAGAPREPMTWDDARALLNRIGAAGHRITIEPIIRAVEAHHKIGAKE